MPKGQVEVWDGAGVSHWGLSAGAAFTLLGRGETSLFLLALTFGALFLFTRWAETGDRSAYAVGTLAGITVPVWLLLRIILGFANDPLFLVNDVPSDAGAVRAAFLWSLRLLGLAVLIATLVAATRPLWVTGLFLRAPQGEVRKVFKRLEASWQLVVALFIGARILVFVLEDVLARWW